MSKQAHDQLIERAKEFICVDGEERGRCEECDLVNDLVAELQRKDAVIARLGDESSFLPPIYVSRTFGSRPNWVKEFDARIDYANTNRYPEE